MADTDDKVSLQVVKRDERRYEMTRYMLLVQELLAMVDRLTAAIPDLTYPGPDSRRFVRRKAGVPRRFVRRTLIALMNAKEMEMLREMDAGTSVDLAQYVEAFETLRSHLHTTYVALAFTLKLKEAQLISRMQTAYAVTKALARDDTSGTMTDTVAQLRRERRRPRRKGRRARKAPRN
ncbi:MAG TPA: hypothetical protein VGF28_06190 [Thermoanaerobaculia bacterium]|jgi:hypothetical protein